MSSEKNTTNTELNKRRSAAIPRGPFHVTPLFASRAEGSTVWDVEGRAFLDFCGGIGVVNVGHNHPKVVEAVKRQTDAALHTCFHVVQYEPYIALAEALNRAVPIPGPCKTALFNSGAEAVENAIKTARFFTKRPAVIAFERGFHGRTLLAMSLTGKCKPYTEGFGPFAPEVYRLPFEPFFKHPDRTVDEVVGDCSEALDRLSHYHIEAESIACVIVEPVLGEGGFYPIHPRAFSLLRAWCTDHGILLIADEVQCGFARCGALFASERYGVKPDVMTIAKSLAGGMVLSAVTGRADIMDAPGIGGIGGTYCGNPAACAAALAVLDIIAEENLTEKANVIGERVLKRFEKLKAAHACVADARGLGAMCALEIVDPVTGNADPDRVKRICAKALEEGLLVMSASGNVIRTLMPLTISLDELDRGLDILERAVSSCAAEK